MMRILTGHGPLLGRLRQMLVIDRTNLVRVYRTCALVLIAIAYLARFPVDPLAYKMAVVICLALAALLLQKLFDLSNQKPRTLRFLVLVEIIGIDLILLSTGGLTSPFIWYATCPALIASAYLSPGFAWLALTFFLGTGISINYFLFNPSQITFGDLILRNAQLILVFILINLMVVLLSGLLRKLQTLEKYQEEAMDTVLSLYQFMEALNAHSTREELFSELPAYTVRLTHCEPCIFWIRDKEQVHASKPLSRQERSAFESILRQPLPANSMELALVNVNGQHYWQVPIQSHAECFGWILACPQDISSIEKDQAQKLIHFIADLCAVTLGRFHLEAVADTLLVLEEQNRIAGEIHDSVAQRLFCISYGLHGLLGKKEDLNNPESLACLTELRDTAQAAMRELRQSIYRWSTAKNGQDYFRTAIEQFLGGLHRLHGVQTKLNISNECLEIPARYENGFIRLIREACSNAIRHGQCQNIQIELWNELGWIHLAITDDGSGFEAGTAAASRGLGLANMKNLAHAFRGTISITSAIGSGTVIDVALPLVDQKGDVPC